MAHSEVQEKEYSVPHFLSVIQTSLVLCRMSRPEQAGAIVAHLEVQDYPVQVMEASLVPFRMSHPGRAKISRKALFRIDRSLFFAILSHEMILSTPVPTPSSTPPMARDGVSA